MNRLTIQLFLLFALFLSLFPACEGMDDNYSSNPNHKLSFSVDTLSFDTVFSSIGSTTRQFLIHNRNNKPLNIANIRLNGNETGFRMNLDGRIGNDFSDIPILAKDSMFVFVEVTVNPTGNNQPLLVKDSIVFSFNGIRQAVQLQAYGQDVHLHKKGHIITEDTYLKADKPYLVYDSLVVSKDVHVEIEEGVTFYLHDKTNVIIRGTMIANGTLENPIIFRGDRLDNITNDLAYDQTPAQWGGIFFKPESYGNIFDHVIIRNGTNGVTLLPSDPQREKLKMTNSLVTNMDGNLFCAINSQAEVINTELTNATGFTVALMSGSYQFTHCTLANHMSLKRRNDTIPHTLILSNSLPDKQTGRLNAHFDNCIIEGNRPAVPNGTTFGEFLIDELSEDTYYRFNHCVLKMTEETGENFIDVEFIKESPTYRLTGGKVNQYKYDFRLGSPTTFGVGKADPVITEEYPLDRYNINRLTSPYGPTIGAYEFVEEEEE